MGVSFRSRQRSYCRTFRLRDSGDAGLACHEKNQWPVRVLAHSESGATTAAGYRQAASSLPPAVLQAVSDAIAGDALDASAEAQARASGWRPKP